MVFQLHNPLFFFPRHMDGQCRQNLGNPRSPFFYRWRQYQGHLSQKKDITNQSSVQGAATHCNLHSETFGLFANSSSYISIFMVTNRNYYLRNPATVFHLHLLADEILTCYSAG